MDKRNYERRGNFFQKKITDVFIFCQPKFNYKQLYGKNDQIIYIEKESNNSSPENYIPCMFYRNYKSKYIMICFHGNSEDIFSTEKYGLDFRSYLNMNVLFVEYPGYSLYMDKNPESQKIFSDSLIVYDWVISKLHFSEEQIFILGRSLGTSPAIYVSSQKNPKALILVSAFTSMKDIGESKGVSSFLEEIFNSIKYIGEEFKCKVLLIHGEKDSLIPYRHSEKLRDEINKYHKNNAKVEIRPNMTHNDFDFKNDIIIQIDNFIKDYKDDNFTNDNTKILKEFKFEPPASIKRIIESKTFRINDFSIISSKDNKDINKKKAKILIRLSDGRIALSHGSNITVYNDRYYKEDITINLIEGNKLEEIINYLCLFETVQKDKKGENNEEDEVDKLICSTAGGKIFLIKIYEGFIEKQKLDVLQKDKQCNIIIHKIEVLNPNVIYILTNFSFNIYSLDDITEELKENVSIENDKYYYYNFIKLDDCFVFVCSRTKIEKNSDNFTVLDYPKTLVFHEVKDNRFDQKGYINLNFENIDYYMAKGSKNSLIIGYQTFIEYIDYDDLRQGNSKRISVNEVITSIYRVHDDLFLVSTREGSIAQILLDENKQINFIKKTFVEKPIECILLKDVKNMKTILFTADDRIWVLSNGKENSKKGDKKEDCKSF